MSSTYSLIPHRTLFHHIPDQIHQLPIQNSHRLHQSLIRHPLLMPCNQPTRQLRDTPRPTLLRLDQQQLNRHVQPGLDVLADHRDRDQRVAEDEALQRAPAVRTSWTPSRRRGRGVHLDPVAVVELVEEREAVRAEVRHDRRFEVGPVPLCEEAL